MTEKNEGAAAEGGRPLTRTELEQILITSGAWKDGKQLRRINQSDIEILMRENGRAWGSAEPIGDQLPLRGMQFARRIDFNNCRLNMADFMDADIPGANFSGAQMFHTLFINAKAVGCDFTEANLTFSEFQGARLDGSNFKDANLSLCYFSGSYLPETNFDTPFLKDIKWDRGRRDIKEYLRPEEAEAIAADDPNQKRVWLDNAEHLYRNLKRAHQNAGMYDVADNFGYREQIMRKLSARTERQFLRWSSLWFAELLFGYGYHWGRVVAASVLTILVFWLAYFALGLGAPKGGLPPILNSLYFSAVSFTAVGYGAWVSTTGTDLGWVKYLGAVESFFGVFLMALFLVTFTRQYLR